MILMMGFRDCMEEKKGRMLDMEAEELRQMEQQRLELQKAAGKIDQARSARQRGQKA